MLQTLVGFLPRTFQLQAQQIKDSARGRTERTDDDRAAAGRKIGGICQGSGSGAVEERQPGQVENKPLGPIIDGPCHVFQELGGREKVQVTAQDEGTYLAIASSLDRQSISVIHRARIRAYRVPSGSRGLGDRSAEVVPAEYGHGECRLDRSVQLTVNLDDGAWTQVARTPRHHHHS